MGNDTVYLDIVPNDRIVIAYTMLMGEYRFPSSLLTFEFVPQSGGTRRLLSSAQTASLRLLEMPAGVAYWNCWTSKLSLCPRFGSRWGSRLRQSFNISKSLSRVGW